MLFCFITSYSICVLTMSMRLILFQLFLLKLSVGEKYLVNCWTEFEVSGTLIFPPVISISIFCCSLITAGSCGTWQNLYCYPINVINIYECIKGSSFSECILKFRWSTGWFDLTLDWGLHIRNECVWTNSKFSLNSDRLFWKKSLAYPAHLWAKIT